MIVDEWVISYRALGRELEGAMASCALAAAAPWARTAGFLYRSGPRNAPALDWLEKVSGVALGLEGRVNVLIPLFSAVAEMPLRVTIHLDERS